MGNKDQKDLRKLMRDMCPKRKWYVCEIFYYRQKIENKIKFIDWYRKRQEDKFKFDEISEFTKKY